MKWLLTHKSNNKRIIIIYYFVQKIRKITKIDIFKLPSMQEIKYMEYFLEIKIEILTIFGLNCNKINPDMYCKKCTIQLWS